MDREPREDVLDTQPRDEREDVRRRAVQHRRGAGDDQRPEAEGGADGSEAAEATRADGQSPSAES
jgi:hypothetical protein